MLATAHQWFAEQLERVKPVLVAVESPIPPHQIRGVTNYSSLALTHGLAQQFLTLATIHNVPTLEVPIRTWRKYCFGTAKMQRAEAKRAALKLCKQLGWQAADDNAAEAALIWLYAGAMRSPRTSRRVEPLFLR